MALAFDTLGFSKRLRDAGVESGLAEAHAEAARDFIMVELVTKADLVAVKSDVLAVKSDVLAVKSEVLALKSDMKSELLAVKAELMQVIETQTLRLTVRLGGLVIAGVGALGLFVKMH